MVGFAFTVGTEETDAMVYQQARTSTALSQNTRGYGLALDRKMLISLTGLLDTVGANLTQSYPVRRVVSVTTGLSRIASLLQNSERPWRQRRHIFVGV